MSLPAASLTEPPRVEFAALIESDRPSSTRLTRGVVTAPGIADRVVFDQVIAAARTALSAADSTTGPTPAR